MCLQDLCEEHEVIITTDNGTDIVKAVELNQWTQFQCVGLHLASGKFQNSISNDLS